ncbi:MAG: hypothetical protein IKC10_00380 [Alphaproteobacteria bacterium]|nr:hypothetical protein [Alphaproteobacteria bacterium]
MKKQFILSLCVFALASCSNFGADSKGYSTLADIFVWGDNDIKTKKTHQGVKVSYKERLPLKTSAKQDKSYDSYKYSDDVDVEYINVEPKVVELQDTKTNDVEVKVVARPIETNKDVIIKEVIIENEDPNEDTQTYTLVKRSERYKDIEKNFSPNIYAILASRVADKFLKDIPGIFADVKNPSLYIDETVFGDRFMPANSDVATNTVKEIITASKMIKTVDDISKASHILKGRLSNINTPEVPVFKYSISLYDKDNKLIDKWSDTIRQVQNDDGSWW